MKKFLVLYNMPVEAMREMMKNSTPEQQEKDMAGWKAWMEQHMSSFVDPGAPIGKNTRVTKAGAEDVSNEVGGFAIVQADSKEEVVKMMEGGPHLEMPGSYTEVMEIMPMPGM
jgi:hypothetical protein